MRKLHTNGMTPPALAIAIALGEKGLTFQIVEIDWRDTAAALLPFSGKLEPGNTIEGEFPILVDDGAVVSDSYFVLEYLEDKYPDPPLRPDDAYGQWQLQALARFLGERALPALSTLGVAQRFTCTTSRETVVAAFDDAAGMPAERRDAWLAAADQRLDEALIAESQRKIGLMFERLEGLLVSSESWLLGKRYTLSDIAAYVLVQPFVAGQLDAGGITISQRVRDWHARVDARPAVRAAMALREAAFLPGPEHARWG